MANTVLIGAQWGDEGKGKIIDVLTRDADVVARFQGGNNAGHTVKIGEETYVLHLIPSGILHDDKICVIGNGVVVDVCALLQELDELKDRGINVEGRLFVSDRAHAVFPFHGALDARREDSSRVGKKIGTTRRGIGPCYSDKVSRVGLRIGDMLGPDFAARLDSRLEESDRMLSALGGAPLDIKGIRSSYIKAAERIAPFVGDTVVILNKADRDGKSILLEGAQGAMLDIDFGTYPFVTSSNTTAGGACSGTGIAPNRIDRILGVVKAYTTRVGEGPFPTELDDETGKMLGRVGREFGATTGRPRRCGWFDAVVARHAAMINGIDSWAITKLDVLDEVETIRICVAYEHNGRRYDTVPFDCSVLSECVPVYEEMEGWQCPTSAMTSMADLPVRAKAYVDRLCELTGVKLSILSVGPGRKNTLMAGQA